MAASPPIRTIRAELAEPLVFGVTPRQQHLVLHVVVDLARTFSRDELLASVRATVEAFPVLGARYESRRWKDRWICEEPDIDAMTLHAAVGEVEGPTREWVRRPMDLRREPPLRVALFEHGNGCRLVVSVHHQAGDGAGSLAVANRVAAALCDAEPFAEVGEDRSVGQLFRSLRLGDIPVLAKEVFREGFQSLTLLRAGRRTRGFEAGDGEPRPHWTTVRLEGEGAARFVRGCKRLGATVNDGLVAALVRAGLSRVARGALAVGYTIDCRRYLREPRAIVSNFAGVSAVVISRSKARTAADALNAVSSAIGEQKRRLPGLAYNLLPTLLLAWMPHGLMRWAGRAFLLQILARVDRALVVTNIGAVDAYLAPFGDDAVRASVVGPFVSLLGTPVVTATGFCGSLTLQVGGMGKLSEPALGQFASEIEAGLEEMGTLD